MEKYKLGKKAPIKKDSISFGDFLTAYPSAPIVDYAPDYNYPMDLNDTIGDCIVAGFDHSRQIITGLLTGTQKNFTNDEIIALYKTQNPNYPNEDNGMSIQLFLEYLVTNKYILGFASIDHTNDAQMKAATYLGLSIMTGVLLQQAQEQQFPNTWEYVDGSPVVGGHCICGAGYNSNTGMYSVITWGKLISASNNFVSKQMDEAWFILMQEHVDHPQFRNYFDLPAFAAAVSNITNGKVNIPINPILKLTSQLTKGPAVVTLQNDLNANGANIVADGVFGAKTKQAIIAFQSIHGLSPDGVVGPKTWQAFDMIRIITQVCNEQGIEPMLGIFVASWESGLDPKNTLFNPPSNSTDRGLFQWNNVYHKEITDAQAFDPVQSTILFCNAVKAGHLHEYWSASQPNWIKHITPAIIAKYHL